MITAAPKIAKPASQNPNRIQRSVQSPTKAPPVSLVIKKEDTVQRKTESPFAWTAQFHISNNHKSIQQKPATTPIQNVTKTPLVQTKIEIGRPDDAYEREADAVAERVMRMELPRPGKRSENRRRPSSGRDRRRGVRRKMQVPSAHLIQHKKLQMESSGTSPPGRAIQAFDIEGKLNSSAGRGSPMDGGTRNFMEPRFGADFSSVQIHTGSYAVQMNNALGSRAFAYGNNIYFNSGQYQPESDSGKTLIAHELTHVVQQGAAVQRKEFTSVSERAPPSIQGWGISDALDYFADAANNIPGFALLTFIIGVNPINMRRVERTPTNLFRAIVSLIPGGNLIFQALQNHGIVERVGNWLQGKFSELGMAASMFSDALDRFLDSLSWSDIFDLGGVWERAKRIFTVPIDRIINFIVGLVTDILRFIREAILRPVAALANGTRGYDMVKCVMGMDPITGDPYPRTAENMIGGFMRLIGQEEKYNQLRESNALGRAWIWFQNQLSILLGFVREIPGLFVRAWEALQINDLLNIPGAFARVAGIFGNFIGNFLTWAGEAAMQIMMFIFEVLAPGAMPALRRAQSVFRTIISDPIRFVGNLVRAGVQGFRQFSTNILTHLRAGLVGWLTGALSGAGLTLPTRWDLRGILSLVLQILGLTWQNIRTKLVRVMGETAVTALETTFDIVVTLVRDGPAAAWQRILEQLGNLQEMVFGQIREWVQRTIVVQAVTRIASMLNPAGAVIQAIIAIYNTVMFFRERMQQIIQVANSFLDSISAIAAGNIGGAANFVEQTMARLVPVVISFLARLIGLGGISDTIRNIINRIRQPIDRALDRLVDWIAAQARRLGSAIMSGARSAANRVLGWLGLRKPFTLANGESHELYFERRGSNTQLVRASALPTEISTFLNSLPADKKATPEFGRAQAQVTRIQQMTRTSATPAANTDTAQETQITDALNILSRELRTLYNTTIPPLPAINWSDKQYNHHARVEYLDRTRIAGGAHASGNSEEMSYVLTRMSASDPWVRMHMISEAVGGSGGPENWIPAPGNVNTGGAVRSFEISMLNMVRTAPAGGSTGSTANSGSGVIWVDVGVTAYQTAFPHPVTGASLTFARTVVFKYGLHRPNATGTAWEKVTTPASTQTVTIPPPPTGSSVINLRSASGTAMENSGIPELTSQSYSARLVYYIKQERGSASSLSDLKDRILAATVNARAFESDGRMRDSIAYIFRNLASNPNITWA